MKNSIVAVVSLLALCSLTISCGRPDDYPKPPAARTIPAETALHGDVRVDDYAWLRDRTNPDVLAYIDAENAYTEECMKPTLPLQDKLFREMLARVEESDVSVPEKIGDYYYYTRTEEGRQYPLACRKKGSLDAPEEVLLDRNELVRGHRSLIIVITRVSPDQRLLLYSLDLDGRESSSLFVKDLATGVVEDLNIKDVIEAEWGNDNRTIFYVREDPAKRPHRLYRHVLGTDSRADQLLYDETDEVFYLHLKKSKSQAYLLAWSESKTTSDVRYLEADRPAGDFKIFHPRQPNMHYSIDHHQDRFFVLTNDQAVNFKLMETPLDRTSRENWTDFIPGSDDVMIEGFDVFKDFVAVYERRRGLKTIEVIALGNKASHTIDFQEPAYTYQAGQNGDYNSGTLRFSYTSFITPSTVIDYDMAARTRDVKKQTVVRGYDPSLYRSERLMAEASDGALVPISLVCKKDIVRDGRNPLLMEGYGSHGSSRDPRFDASLISLLDRGFVYAIAHIRGGSDLGVLWHEHGKFLRKKNTFSDFVACAEHLIREKYTSPEKFAIRGGSSGGLLMGAVLNLKPELFKVAVARVPFVDCLNTLLDPSLFLTTYEWEEYGNPNEKEYYAYIKSWAPYENVTARSYPHILATGGLNDRRVSYWEPLKWVAKLRAKKTDHNLLLCRIYLDAGHGGPLGRYDALKEAAFNFAFILDRLGIHD